MSSFIGKSPDMMNVIKEDGEGDDMFSTVNYTKNNMSMISNHYEVPNMTSMLYEFTNKEQERVH
jgi:hypothetical protein